MNKTIIFLFILLFIVTGCVTESIKTDETKSFETTIKNKYKCIESCIFTSRSGHTFKVKYTISSEIDESMVENIFEDTRQYLVATPDVVINEEVAIEFTFIVDGVTSGRVYINNKKDMDAVDQWIIFE